MRRLWVCVVSVLSLGSSEEVMGVLTWKRFDDLVVVVCGELTFDD